MAKDHTGAPAGTAYEWLHRGLDLLARGHAAAAAVLLQRAVDAEPGQASLLEALGRAQYDAGRHAEAARTFAELVELSPDADYARFGLGLSLSRVGRFAEAVEQLALAAAMRPQNTEYADRLRQARATLAAQRGSATGAAERTRDDAP